ncbi:MAG: cation diffusion facilitator family transporter [Bacteroidales bacterium]|nr:cation diffusion facilitator family transporter [Bacteroidales bacterium]MCF8334274.1 cation diffusion facilitator family transporter [Bacteroidales bacterium]
MSTHHQHHNINEKNLRISIILNLGITVAEVVGGLVANSLSLLSDALHNLSDGLALLMAYIAHKFSKKDATHSKTFGYKRVEILSAFLNSVILVGVSIYLFVEAVERFFNPEPINGIVMLSVALVGLIANLVSVIILQKDSKFNLNIKAAYLHLIGDTLSSVAVIAGGLLIYFYDIFWVDPLVTVLIGVYILKQAYSILKETIDILMQGTPKKLDLEQIKNQIEAIEQVHNIHHVHTWALNENEIHFEAHVDLKKDLKISDTDELLEKIDNLLYDNFGIGHVTLQFEHNACREKELVKNQQKST